MWVAPAAGTASRSPEALLIYSRGCAGSFALLLPFPTLRNPRFLKWLKFLYVEDDSLALHKCKSNTGQQHYGTESTPAEVTAVREHSSSEVRFRKVLVCMSLVEKCIFLAWTTKTVPVMALWTNSTGKQTSPSKTTIYIFCRKEVLCEKSFLDLGPHSTKIWKVRLIEGPLPGWSIWKRRMCLICTHVQYYCSGVLYLCTFGFLLMKKN